MWFYLSSCIELNKRRYAIILGQYTPLMIFYYYTSDVKFDRVIYIFLKWIEIVEIKNIFQHQNRGGNLCLLLSSQLLSNLQFVSCNVIE